MVQWADLTGMGFSPHDRGSAPGEYWAAAERLLHEDLEQPPELIRSTQGHPVWTLRRVAVAGKRRWCFVVQGRRGPFGVAGSCRFAFAPPAMGAARAWQLGQQRAADPDDLADAKLDHAEFRQLVHRTLAGVALDRAAIPVQAAPGDTAAVVAAVLRVLPEQVSRLWSWSTCMLQRPDDPRLRVVSGRWPAEFRDWDPRRADSVAQLFRRGPADPGELDRQWLHRPELQRGFQRLVEHATGQRSAGPLPPCQDLDDLLVALDQAHHRPGWRDVPALLARPQDLLGHLGIVTTWARREPVDAVHRLPGDLPDEITGALLTGVLEAQDGTGDNLLHLPTAGRKKGAEWHERLAGLLLRHHGDGVRDLVAGWAAPGGPLAGPADLVAARAWLGTLGLDPRTDPELFPPDDRIIVAELARHRACTPAVAAELALAADPIALLRHVAPRLGPLLAATVAELLTTVCPTPASPLDGLTELARALTATAIAGFAPGPASDWADDLLRRIPAGEDDPRPRRIMYGVVLAVLGRGEPRGDLVHRCRRIGRDAHVPPEVAEWLQWASRPASPPRFDPPSPPARARLGAAQLASVLPPRVRLPLVVAVVAVIGTLGAATALLNRDEAPRDRTPAAATAPAPIRPGAQDFAIVAVPGDPPDKQAQKDRDALLGEMANARIRPGAATGILLIGYRTPAGQPVTSPDRLARLRTLLESDARLAVPVRISLDDPVPNQAAGVLSVTVFYLR